MVIRFGVRLRVVVDLVEGTFEGFDFFVEDGVGFLLKTELGVEVVVLFEEVGVGAVEVLVLLVEGYDLLDELLLDLLEFGFLVGEVLEKLLHVFLGLLPEFVLDH